MATRERLLLLFLLAIATLVALLSVIAPHETSSAAGNTQPGRQLRQQRRLEIPQQQQQHLLETVAATVGAAAAWDWQSPIVASENSAQSCRWTNFAPRDSLHGNASMCMRTNADLLADEIRNKGYWPECVDLPTMLRSTSSSTTSGRRPLFVDVGANVGACSLHMLLATDADVISFEPGGDNLFYASSTLLRLVQSGIVPDAARRLLLVRAGLGAQENQEEFLHQAIGNAGHAVVGVKLTKYAPLGHAAPQRIVIRQLDELLWPRQMRDEGKPPPTIDLLKIDVEGFECQSLTGMQALLKAGAIRAIKLEVFDGLLQLQGCNAIALQRIVAKAGFLLYKSEVAPGDGSGASAPIGSPLDPERSHATVSYEPYNLWCVYRGPSAIDPPPPSPPAVAPPTPPPTSSSETEDGNSNAAGGALTSSRRRRFREARRSKRRLSEDGSPEVRRRRRGAEWSDLA